MSYVPTDWVDGVTPVDAAHMDNLEAGVSGAVAKDAVVVAGTRLVANKLAVGHAQPAFRLLGDGKQEWGPGGSTAPDTNLYRLAGGYLKTDGGLLLNGGVYIDNDDDGSRLYFGSAQDTSLYRSAADILATDDSFRLMGAAVNIAFPNHSAATNGMFFSKVAADTQYRFIITAEGKINWGPGGAVAADTVLYRSGAGVLRSDSYIAAFSGATETILIPGGIQFGGDANLYRTAASKLKTDGALESNAGFTSYVSDGVFGATARPSKVGTPSGAALHFGYWDAGSGQYAPSLGFGHHSTAFDPTLVILQSKVQYGTPESQPRWRVRASGLIEWGPGGATAPDTVLYRAGASHLKTDNSFTVGNTAVAATYLGLACYVGGVGLRDLQVGGSNSGGSGLRAVVVAN